MHSRTARGFTLIELLVVIAIIGILASIILASLSSARTKGRDARRVQELKSMGQAMALLDNGGAAVALVGCVGAHAKVNTCTGVGTGAELASFVDPSAGTGGTACTTGAAAYCQY